MTTSVTIVAVDPATITPYTIPQPHKLYTARTLPTYFQPDHPIYLILPSRPYTEISPSIARRLLNLTKRLPSRNLTLLFPNKIDKQDATPYETLFNAPSLISHPAANILSTLPSSTTTTTQLSITLPSKFVLQDLLLLHPSTPNTPNLPNTATLVARGASPPPTHTVNAIPGYKLTHIPSGKSKAPHFLAQLYSNNVTFLLRFPDCNHLFLYKCDHTWHGLLLPKFQTSSIPYLNPTAIARHLKHPPRIPVYRPLLPLPTYHKPPNTPPNFRCAVYTVAHRTQPSDPYHPPTSADITALDTRILGKRIKHSSPTVSQLKRARFNRLHVRSSNPTNRVKQSVITTKQKRLKTRYFTTALSTVLSALTARPKFFVHPYAELSWQYPGDQVANANAFDNTGIHGVEFCDEGRDSCISSCENLIGKSVAEFAYSNIGRHAARKIRTALATLRKQIPNKVIESAEKATDEAMIHTAHSSRGEDLNSIININPLTVLPSQVEA